MRKTIRSEQFKKQLTTRLNRIGGQVNGVKQMIEEDRYCDDVIIQLSAISSAIKSLSNLLFENHLSHCVKEKVNEEDYQVIEEVMNLVKRFQ